MSLLKSLKEKVQRKANEVGEEDLDAIIKQAGEMNEMEDRAAVYVGAGHLRNGVPYINPIGRY